MSKKQNNQNPDADPMDNLRTAVMVDILYAKETKRVFKSSTWEYFLAKDWQVFPFFSFSKGFSYGNSVRMLVYAGIAGGESGDMYLAQNGQLWSPAWTVMSGHREMTLGGIGCGCTEIPMYNNPPGLHDKRRRGRTEPSILRPMRISVFHDRVCRAEDSVIAHRSILPCIYADTKHARATDKDSDPTVQRVWTPDKGFIQVEKTPITVCLTSYTEFLSCWSDAYMSRLPEHWQFLCEEWMRAHEANNLYLGYDFQHTPEPDDGEIDHLFTPQELEASDQLRLVHYSKTYLGDLLYNVDVNRPTAKEALKRSHFLEADHSNLYGIEL